MVLYIEKNVVWLANAGRSDKIVGLSSAIRAEYMLSNKIQRVKIFFQN